MWHLEVDPPFCTQAGEVSNDFAAINHVPHDVGVDTHAPIKRRPERQPCQLCIDGTDLCVQRVKTGFLDIDVILCNERLRLKFSAPSQLGNSQVTLGPECLLLGREVG